jgi:hypothetical protein
MTVRPDRSGSAVRRSPRRHPTGGQVYDGPKRPRHALSARWVLALILFGAVFAGLRGIHALADSPDVSAIATLRVVVVGVTGRTEPTAADRTILGTHLGDAQVGAISIRARYLSDCAAAGWTTLGAGRRAAVGGLCAPQVVKGSVPDWAARTTAAAARDGDARLGTLASSVSGCVAAIGPGAALAAAKPDGTLARYQTAPDFIKAGMKTSCPITIVDAGGTSDEIVAKLAKDPDVTVIVTGIGPAAGSSDPSLQLVYRLGTTLPGWLTSASTRRSGIVTLTDLTRTLIDFGPPEGSQPLTEVDGSPFAVDGDNQTPSANGAKISSIAALSDAAPLGYLSLGIGGAVLFVILIIGIALNRLAVSRLILTFGAVLLASMMLTGAVPWDRSSRPGLYLSLAVAAWSAILTSAAILLGRLLRVPAAIAAAGITVAALTIDAAMGGPMQPGSMLNSRPIFGLRWYGFGNVTFASYATAGLLLAGYVAHRFLAAGRRRAATIVVAATGFGVVVCEGWPTMGADFGGVIALTPAVMVLIISVSGIRLTAPKLIFAAATAVIAVGLISFLDWSRGPDRRSHLGNFVQRIIDGDALDVISRKAVAAAHTVASPLGLGSLIIGIALWIAIFRYALPAVSSEFRTLRGTLVAALVTAILGTLLNDGGISVWLTATAAITVTTAWFLVDHALREGWTIRSQPSPASVGRGSRER